MRRGVDKQGTLYQEVPLEQATHLVLLDGGEGYLNTDYNNITIPILQKHSGNNIDIARITHYSINRILKGSSGFNYNLDDYKTIKENKYLVLKVIL